MSEKVLIHLFYLKLNLFQEQRNYTINTAGAFTLYITEMLKIPVSTTHTITGAIIGVGATKRLSAVRWGVTKSLMTAWVLTIPVSGLLACGFGNHTFQWCDFSDSGSHRFYDFPSSGHRSQ